MHLPARYVGVCGARARAAALAVALAVAAGGCGRLKHQVGFPYAPLCSPGVRACELPDEFRIPRRTAGAPLNYCNLTIRPPRDYILGPNDLLDVTVANLFQDADKVQPLRVMVMSSGEVHLPLVGPVHVGGQNLLQAQQRITAAYADGFFPDPQVNVVLAAPATVSVLVLGEVNTPGMYELPKYQNDVGHAVAAAGGLGVNAAYEIEVHHRLDRVGLAVGGDGPSLLPEPTSADRMRPRWERVEPDQGDPKRVLTIPLRGLPPEAIREEDVVLQSGDVVVVPSRRAEVFFVVGQLSPNNFIRFSLDREERELGGGFVLPRDNEVDVVTAVAMAGYIDPIDSPTTVTVHRRFADGRSMLILVDLIAARFDWRETVLIEPGDIVYINPDAAWWFRRTFDRVVPELITIPYDRFVGPENGN